MGIASSYSKKWDELAQYLKAHGADEDQSLTPVTASRPRPKTIRMFQDDELEQLEARYRAGASVYALAREFHCHRETVANKLKERGVVMRGNKTTDAQIAQMVKLSKAGKSPATIAMSVGVAEKTVAHYLRKQCPSSSPH